RVHISHFKVAGGGNWPRIDGGLGMARRAQSEGARLTADQNPYIAGSTMLGAGLSPLAHAGGGEGAVERAGGAGEGRTVASADERDRMRAAMLDRSRSSWDNFWKWSGPEGIVVSDIASGRHHEYLGRNLAEAARLSKRVDRVSEEEAAEFAFDLLLAEGMG